jgi:hypothetical protein
MVSGDPLTDLNVIDAIYVVLAMQYMIFILFISYLDLINLISTLFKSNSYHFSALLVAPGFLW